jgi:hypothetical protein
MPLNPPLGSLLDMAMISLNIDAAKEKRRKIFDANQLAVGNILKVSSNTVGNLQIKPNINGEADSQALQPVKFSDSFEIELSKLSLPNQCGAGPLRDVIGRLCHEHSIQTDEKIDTATYTSVVTALAGQHTESDADCASVTKAEFVPVFNSMNDEKRALVLCYSLNGDTKLRVDHLRVRGSMTCLGRKSSSSTALQAIEIPNLLAAEMREDKPELFEQLQKNACLVAFVEYDLIQPQPTYATSSSSMFTTRGGPVMRGVDMGMTRGGFNESFSSSATRGGGGSIGVSAYSVIGQGSQAQDHSSSVYESGQKKLKKIHVYLIGAIVVNTNEQTLVPAQCENIAKLMQARANELNNLYLPYKTYKFHNLNAEMEDYVKKYNITCTHTDILEHAILRLGSIDENPTGCQTNPSQQTPQYFFIDFGLSIASINKLVSNLQAIFGNEFCEYTPQFNPRNGLRAVRFSLELVSKNSSLIKKNIDEILAEQRNLLAYQKYSRQESSAYNNVVKQLSAITQYLGINTKSDCVEIVLLKMFSCEEELTTARFQPGITYVAKMLDTHFFFDISENAAKQLVDRINLTFPNQARFICANTTLADKGATLLSEISIDNTLLCSQAFLLRFKDTLNTLAEDNPLLIEKLRIQSGAQQRTSKDYADKLVPMALLYKSVENANHQGEVEANPKQKLGEALLSFSDVISSPQCKKSERFSASDKVRQALAFFESTQTSVENELFKKGDKKAIKETQKALGLRK